MQNLELVSYKTIDNTGKAAWIMYDIAREHYVILIGYSCKLLDTVSGFTELYEAEDEAEKQLRLWVRG